MNPAPSTLASLSTPSALDAALRGALATLALEYRGSAVTLELAASALLSGGHLLLEGPPGIGKTSLAQALARAFGGSFRRVQMTSDLLPSDIVGLLRLKPGSTEFEFREGPIFSNVVLADELNRTSPKTQSALLEAMAEGTVSVDGTTHPLPDPFFVIATQNPLEFQGVYPLAESQLDRFALCLQMGSPDRATEEAIYSERLASRDIGDRRPVAPTASAAGVALEQTRALRLSLEQIRVAPDVLAYATELVRATREHPSVTQGASVRGGLALLNAARGLALVRGRKFVTPTEVRDLALPVLAHRLCFAEPETAWPAREAVIREVVEKTPSPA